MLKDDVYETKLKRHDRNDGHACQDGGFPVEEEGVGFGVGSGLPST